MQPSRHVLWIAGLVALLALLVARRYDSRTGLTSLVQFDVIFQSRQNPVLATIPHHVRSPTGYDGQFYAQIALDPLLLDPATPAALDAPSYRARRIVLPTLAFLAGLGRPAWIIQVYPLLNLAFWLLLLAILVKYLQPANAFARCALTAILFSSGTLESVRLALTDLPAATLSLWPCFLNPATLSPLFLLACAGLTRETSILAAFSYYAHAPSGGLSLRRRLTRGILALLPLALWLAYAGWRFGLNDGSHGNLGLPGVAAWNALAANLVIFRSTFSPGALGAVAAVLGLFSQAIYLWVNPSLRDPVWRLGAAFSLLLLFLGPAVWEAHLAACRAVLPLTFAFNIILCRDARPRWALLVAANSFSAFGLYKFLTYAT